MNNQTEIQSMIKRIVKESIDSLKKDLLNEDYHHHKKDYRMYEGANTITAMFEDNSRLKFEVHFRHNRGEDKDKWRKKALTKWRSLASQIHGDVTLSDACNPIQKTWKESFTEALEHPELQEYIRKNPHHQIYPKSAPVMDPVNFTSH